MEEKLLSSIQSNSYKIIELYNKMSSGSLETGPYFQRKKFWKRQDKVYFIETILMNYPFPEIYIASKELDLENLTTKEMVVDGQQRLTTIVDYIKGHSDFSGKLPIKKFNELTDNEKKDFLNYPVSVKDLKNLNSKVVEDVFLRINATDYSLNENERLNATYGGGEFAYFAKQLTDLTLDVSESHTNVIVSHQDREKVANFFINNGVFSNNDVNRMFDSQYLMLVASTILSQAYFGRSSKIVSFLEDYNDTFSQYPDVLSKILNSISIIDKLRFNRDSYWFNKANLFTLLIEFNQIDSNRIDFDVLEASLLDLEKKFDIYFSAVDENDLKGITEDERKYFEYARHGSHEQPAREHRGGLIRGLIEKATIKEDLVSEKRERLDSAGIDYTIIIPTETGLNKAIMDATSTVREFLKRNNIHDYETQQNGPDHKVRINGVFVDSAEGETPTEISMYKSNGRGDCRIWFTNLKEFARPKDELAIYFENDLVKVLNLNR